MKSEVWLDKTQGKNAEAIADYDRALENAARKQQHNLQ